ncbi:MAG: hypothetical protein MMC33_007227 [Icmadophila ericetorum]|nr:hypothetical protein [Icmadophila ericetorum]
MACSVVFIPDSVKASLYKGYKRRNGQLDALTRALPHFSANSTVDQESVLEELHNHLWELYKLLYRVISARKLHHSRFFFLSLDYGHQHFLDNLRNQKHIVLRALERLERRTVEVLFQNKAWYKWARQPQDDEEAQREKEVKKTKREAALFKRHWKEVELRTRALRAKENERRQEKFLDALHKLRTYEEADGDDSDWDPIEEVVENERGSFLDLIRHFLWLEQPADRESNRGLIEVGPSSEQRSESERFSESECENPRENQVFSNKTRGKKPKKKKTPPAVEPILKSIDKDKIESRADVQSRLRQGSIFKHEYGPVALLVKGTVNAPLETATRTPPLPDSEIDRLLEDIGEIKHLLLCRLVDDFLNDAEVSDGDLRDLCLEMEQPQLADIRDACADLMRSAEVLEEDDEAESASEDSKEGSQGNRRLLRLRKPRGTFPEAWLSKTEKQPRKNGVPDREDFFGVSGLEAVDFGVIDDEGVSKRKKIRVKICGDQLRMQQLQLGFIPYFQFTEADKATVRHQTGSRGEGRRMHALYKAHNIVCAHIQRSSAISRRFIQYLAMKTADCCLLVRDVKTGKIVVQPPENQLWLFAGEIWSRKGVEEGLE